MATPVTRLPAHPGTGTPKRGPRRSLRLDEILTLLVADGLIASEEAENLARTPVRRTEHPLEIVAEKNWHAATGPRHAH